MLNRPADRRRTALPTARPVVLDTHVVLDLWVFDDPTVQTLRDALAQGRVRWIATTPMREELARVLGYPAIAQRLVRAGRQAEAVLQAFDAHATLVPAAPALGVACRDPDDQKFIDLAAANAAMLLSRDRAVLALRKRLVALGSDVQSGGAGWIPPEHLPTSPSAAAPGDPARPPVDS